MPVRAEDEAAVSVVDLVADSQIGLGRFDRAGQGNADDFVRVQKQVYAQGGGCRFFGAGPPLCGPHDIWAQVSYVSEGAAAIAENGSDCGSDRSAVVPIDVVEQVTT
jgi:hypothetical protein